MIIHLTGTDGAVFGRVSADVIGEGFGGPAYRGILGEVHVIFQLDQLPNGNSPSATLTQAKFDNVNSATVRDPVPKQQDLSISYRYERNEALKLIALMKSGEFNLRFGLNLGQVERIYKISAPIDPGVLDAFLACAAKTSIYEGTFTAPP